MQFGNPSAADADGPKDDDGPANTPAYGVAVYNTGQLRVGELPQSASLPPPDLFLRVYGERITVRREPAVPESWLDVRRRWGPGGQRRPDGIILVEEVAAVVAADSGASASEAARQVWGLVVQPRGMECASCYVLDTCHVRSPAGLCTHFCLVRVQCFGDPVELQLRNAWLNRLAGHR